MAPIVRPSATAYGAVVSALSALLIKYADTKELTVPDYVAASLAIGASILSMVPLDKQKIVEEFNNIVSGYIQGSSFLTPLMLDQLMKASTSKRPYYIVNNSSDDLLWINAPAALEQSVSKNQPFGGKSTNMSQYHFPEILEEIKLKLIRKDEFLSCHKAFQLLTKNIIVVETYFSRVELEDGTILRVSTGIG